MPISVRPGGCGGEYSGYKFICTCEMGLTFSATIDFVAIEIGKVLETLELISLIDKGDKRLRILDRKSEGGQVTILSPRE